MHCCRMSAQAISPLSQPAEPAEPAHTSLRALYIPDPLPPSWPLYTPRPLPYTPTLRTLSPTHPIVYPCICQPCSNAGNSLCSAPLSIHAIGTSSSLTQAEPPLTISRLHPKTTSQRHSAHNAHNTRHASPRRTAHSARRAQLHAHHRNPQHREPLRPVVW
jgi:hypothetical protein